MARLKIRTEQTIAIKQEEKSLNVVIIIHNILVISQKKRAIAYPTGT